MPPSYITTKQLPDITGLSVSYFEKGRIYGYGPPYIKVKTGKVLYRPEEVEAWMVAQRLDPEAQNHV